MSDRFNMKNWFWCMLCCLGIGVAQAQAPILVSSSQRYFAVGGEQVLFVEDRTHGLSFEAFREMPDSELLPAEGAYINFGVTTSAYWIKFKILNPTGEKCYIRINNPVLDTARLYVFSGERLWVEKSILAREPEFSVPVSPFSLPATTDTLTCYLRLSANVPFLVPIDILREDTVWDVVFEQSIFDLLFFGAVCIMLCYNLFIGISINDKAYYYYAYYSLMIGISTIFIRGYPVVFLGEYQYIINDYFAIYVSAIPFFLNLFTISFLHLQTNYRPAARWLHIMCGVHIFVIAVFVAGFVNLNVALFQITNAINNFSVLWVAIYMSYYKKSATAKIFLVAFSIFLTLSTAFNLTFANMLPFSLVTVYYLHIGGTIELTLFSFALSNKLNLYRREKEEAQEQNLRLIREQNTVLERKVLERTQQLQETNEALNHTLQVVEVERAKSDKLLLNILPAEVASELKETGKTEVRYFESVTVLFADVKGFSAFATKISPQELIAELDATFSKMDEISTRFGLERIKTIGDCYMACGGLPHANQTHPFDVVLAALNIQHWMAEERARRQGDFWQVRLGVHTGDAVAGVIGKTKFAYDVWGNTINLAARMEGGGSVGRVNVTYQTYKAVSDFFEGEYMEEMEAKNIGKVRAYAINRLRPEFSADALGFEPNERFWAIYKAATSAGS
jgi:class 3 adenylate cyclase